MSLGKGKKSCPECGLTTGPRAYVCKQCNHIFVFKMSHKEKKTVKAIKDFNWKDLQKGDRIRVGGGPYFLNDGELIPMGYRGRFLVDGIDDKGIRAFGLDKHQGFCHIYMGEDIQSKETGIWKTKHKLIKLKNKEKDTV
jgi:DNA-directed RNA polymerase subunit RPC12/RpoP